MSLDKNILKDLLCKLLGNRLQKLEARNQQQIKDLKMTKFQCKNQEELLNKIIIKKKNKIERKKTFDNPSLYNRRIINKYRNTQDLNKLKFSKGINIKYNSRNAFTPLRNNNNSKYLKSIESQNQNKNIFINKKYNYVKSRYRDSNAKYNIINKKINMTPEPKIKKRKKIDNKNLKINIHPKKLNFITNKINNNEKEEQNKIKNINTIKKEEDHEKRTIISNIGLDEDQIAFVLEELEKENKEREELEPYIDDNEKESNSSYNKDKESNSDGSRNSFSSCNTKKTNKMNIIKNKEIINKFNKYLISSDGKKIVILICSFLDDKEAINFLSYSKKLLGHLIYYLDGLYNKLLYINNINNSNTIEIQINNIKKKYNESDLDSPKYAFSLSKGSVKALDLLNEESYNKIFTKKKLEPPLDKILLVYRIFFQLIGKEDFVNINNNKLFWEKTRNYILDNNKGKTGDFFKEYINEFDFTNKNIYKLKKLIFGVEDTLKPLYFGDICKTTGLVIFIIKDSLEYCGLIHNDKKTMPIIYINYLEYIQNIISKLKEYIEKLKQL